MSVINTWETQLGHQTIRGFVRIPDKAGPLPAVIMCHGFGGRAEGLKPYAQLLSDYGYLVVGFSFRGGGPMSESDGNMLDMSMKMEVEDLLHVLHEVERMPEVDPQRIFVLGGSQGGLVATLAAPLMEETIAGMILFSPGLRIPDMVRNGDVLGKLFPADNPPEELLVNGVTVSQAYLLDMQTRYPYNILSSLQLPICLCHGTDDCFFPVADMERAQRVQPALQMHIIQGGDHYFAQHGTGEAYAIVHAFIQEQIK